MSDLDLTEAIVLAARSMSTHWRDMHTNEALGLQRMLATHAVSAAAPIIARQMAEKVARAIDVYRASERERIGSRNALIDNYLGGMIEAARIAREVGSDV